MVFGAEELPSSKIADLVTTVDTHAFQTQRGPMLWATVEVTYDSQGLEPSVVIRVPIPAIEDQGDELRRAEALKGARKLIDHACSALQPEPDKDQPLPAIDQPVFPTIR